MSSTSVHATVITNWADWTLPGSYPLSAIDPLQANGQPEIPYYYATGATGSLILPGASPTTVTFTLSGEVSSYSLLNSGNWANPYQSTTAASYLSSYVGTSPVGSDYITQTGYTLPQYKAHSLTFSAPVTDLVFAIKSLGAPTKISSLKFSQPFTILSQNGQMTASGDSTTGYVLSGYEGAGVIQFLGTFTTLSWVVTDPEVISVFNIAATDNPYSGYGEVIPYIFPSNELPAPFGIGDIVTASMPTGGWAASNIGITFNPRFDGGILLNDLTSGSTISTDFTITSNGGTIDPNGRTVTFSGIISNDEATGDQGTLQIGAGGHGGVVILTGVNTYTGGTQINASATLALSGSGSLASTAVTNSGTFDITGSSPTVNLAGSYTQGTTGALVMAGASGTTQLLNVGGAASLDGALGLSVTSGGYNKGRYELIAANSVSGQFSTFATNLSSYTNMLYALDYRADGVYLVVGVPDKGNTLLEIARSGAAQQNLLASQGAQIANTFSYDCAVFGPGGVCLSFNSRVSSLDGSTSGAGVLVGAYRVTPSLRVGGYIDYQVATTDPHGLSQKDPQPIFGAFIGYSQDGLATGWQAKVGGAFENGHVAITRDASLSNTEPGSGHARTRAFGLFAEMGYGFMLDETTVATPAIGLRHIGGSRSAYSESVVPGSVDYPLSFDKFAQRKTTASLGLRMDGKVTDALTWRLGLGVDYDVHSNVDSLSGDGLVSVGPSPAYVLQGPAKFNVPLRGGRNRLHPVLDVGLTYRSAPNQALTANIGIRDRTYSSGTNVNVSMGYRVSF